MQDPDVFDYQAFISYRHRPDDSAFAQWLVEAIETFETPDRLQQEGYPAKIGKVFRDEDELRAEPELTPAIKKALWASEYLLVVCSEATPQSAWVRAEIKLFQHWGRGDRIIPVLIDGTPDLSFPPELFRTEVVGEGFDAEFKQVVPRGPDLTKKQAQTEEEAKTRALLTIAATMLGCAFSSLKDRFEERIHKLTSFEYFREMTRKRGAPFGVGPISEDQAGKLNVSYRFESRAGRVVRVQRLNGHGYMRENDDGISIFDFVYRDDGSVEQVNHRNRNNVVKLRERFNHDQTILDFIHEDDSASPTEALASGIGFAAPDISSGFVSKSTILRHLLTYDENGFVIEALFCRDTFNTPGRDGLGHYGQGFERNAVGLATKEWALDAKGQSVTQQNGVRFKAAKHNSDGLVIEEAYLDENSLPVLHKDGVARFTSVYDARGNRVEVACFGVAGEPVLDKDGNAGFTSVYDARGNCVEVAYFGVAGEPVLDKDGNAGFTSVYDARGNCVEVAYFGVAGEPVLHKDGFARFTSVYDARGNLVDRAFFGVAGEPVLDKDGIARFTSVYDARGNCVEVACFGVAGEPVLHKDGFARFTSVYDARGNCVERAYFDVDNNPINRRGNWSGQEILANPFGGWQNIVIRGLLDETELEQLTRTGFARIVRKLDDRQNEINRQYFDKDGNPTPGPEGFSSFDMNVNVFGQPLLVRPVMMPDGPQICIRFAYTHRRLIDLVQFEDVDSNPTTSKLGFASLHFLYDDKFDQAGVQYFDADGGLIETQN